MTMNTTTAAAIAGCDPLVARRLGVAMLSRPEAVPLWQPADVRQLCAAITLANDSEPGYFNDEQLERVTRGARHSFLRFIVVRGRTGIAVRDMRRVVALIGSKNERGAVRVISLHDMKDRKAVAS